MSDQQIILQIVTSSGMQVSCLANIVTLPGTAGELGVMHRHIHLITNLSPGIVKTINNNIIDGSYFIYKGIAQITDSTIVIMTEFIVNINTIQKKYIVEQIEHYKSKLALDYIKPSNAAIIRDYINKYETTLNFLESAKITF